MTLSLGPATHNYINLNTLLNLWVPQFPHQLNGDGARDGFQKVAVRIMLAYGPRCQAWHGSLLGLAINITLIECVHTDSIGRETWDLPLAHALITLSLEKFVSLSKLHCLCEKEIKVLAS